MDKRLLTHSLYFSEFEHINKTNEQLADFLHMSSRSVGRNALIQCVSIKNAMEKFDYKKFSKEKVGVYCAVQPPILCQETTTALIGTTDETLHHVFKKKVHPFAYLKYLSNTVSGWASIMLGATGPTKTFTNETLGSLHALNQAEIDLFTKKIDLAFVCAVFTLDNKYLFSAEKNRLGIDQILCEGAACAIMTPSAMGLKRWQTLPLANMREQFGIANQLVYHIKNEEN